MNMQNVALLRAGDVIEIRQGLEFDVFCFNQLNAGRYVAASSFERDSNKAQDFYKLYDSRKFIVLSPSPTLIDSRDEHLSHKRNGLHSVILVPLNWERRPNYNGPYIRIVQNSSQPGNTQPAVLCNFAHLLGDEHNVRAVFERARDYVGKGLKAPHVPMSDWFCRAMIDQAPASP